MNLLIIGQPDKAWTLHGFVSYFLVITSERFYVLFTLSIKLISPRQDPSYRPRVRLRLQLDNVNSLTFLYTISLVGPSSCSQLKFGWWEKVRNPIFNSTFQINTLQGVEKKSGWLLTVILSNYVLQCCYVFEEVKDDPSIK